MCAVGIATGPPALTTRQRIAALKEAQKLLKEDGKRVTKDIRNAERRSKRLKTRVQGLTDSDLSEVLSARAEQVALQALRKGQSAAKKGSPQQSSRSPAAGCLRRAASAPDVVASAGILPVATNNRGATSRDAGQ